MTVYINGTEYVPAGNSAKPTFAVAITTRNRNDLVAYCVGEFRKHTNIDFPIIVVDDASDTPVALDGVTVHRFDENVGIARAKNKCLELLMETGADHFFLADDDCYPKAEGWHQPYVDSPYGHLCYLFKDVDRRKYLSTPPTLYDDGTHLAYSHPRGCLLYVDRPTVNTVGGMRPEFGKWGWDHVEYSSRIYNAGLIPFKFMDIVGSSGLWYSIDEHYVDHPGFTRAVDAKTRKELVVANEQLFNHFADSKDFVEYREQRNPIVTCLFTGVKDPQGRPPMKPDRKLLSELLRSTRQDTVVLHNEVLQPVDFHDPAWVSTEQIQLDTVMDVYHARWFHYWRWLKDNENVRMCWFVDGTDVEMLHTPFPHMRDGVLYVGSESTVVGCEWMAMGHAASRDWITTHAGHTLLNAGLVGGDRVTVMEFMHRLIGLWATDHANGMHDAKGDMAHFNRAAYSMPQVEFGPQINTVFKAYDHDNKYAYWRHK